MNDESILERLAALEHEQWMAWSQSIADEVSVARRRGWKKCWVPEEIKELDRDWAAKVIAMLEEP